MGSAVARDLVRSKNVDHVSVLDVDSRRLRTLREIEGSAKLSVVRHDVSRTGRTVKLLRGFDVGVGALPHGLSDYAVESALRAGVSFVDLIYGWRFRSGAVDRSAKKKGITIIPACGLAPGLTNILAMNAADRLDRVDEVHIKVGGIPENPKPPLNYRIVFSFEAVLEEYFRKAQIIKNGRLAEAEALSGLETFNFPRIGRVECFYTDGLSTLIRTLRRAREMDEKTIRWPGHVAQIKTLIECGLLDTKAVQFDGQRIAPRKFLADLLSDRLALRDERDLTLLRVDVNGKRRHSPVHYRFDMVDRFDARRKLTSMARTTAFPCSVVAQMLGNGTIQPKGLVPPEHAVRGSLVKPFMRELQARGIRIESRLIS